jgi:hypothetical protein
MTQQQTVHSSMSLLEKTQSLIQVERSLTATLERVEPWLTTSSTSSSTSTSCSTKNTNLFGKRVRPIPTTMEQVHQVLAVGRNLASRTSAPAGWNPMAPVVGFSTPNPLPHQLRGGALAALQLERARQAERDRKRQRKEEAEAAKKLMAETTTNSSSQEGVAAAADESKDKQQQANPTTRDNENRPKAPVPVRRTTSQQRPQQQVLATTMNLSDSSSSEEESEDES